jgi:hypothetical protein
MDAGQLLHAESRATWNQEAFEYLVRELGYLKKELREKESW